MPDVSVRIYGGVVAVAVLLAFAASLGTARLGAVRGPAVAAVGH